MRIILFMLWSSLLMAAHDDPFNMIQQTADYVLQTVKKNRSELIQNNRKIYALVSEKIIPHFDFKIMVRGAVGRYWRLANESQKKQLENQFKELLIRTYAMGLLDYTEYKIDYLPTKFLSAKKAMVMTRVRNDQGESTMINYRLYKNKAGEWKIYDVIVDGMGLVSNYRSAFSAEIKKHGIEGLIQKMQQHNQKFHGIPN